MLYRGKGLFGLYLAKLVIYQQCDQVAINQSIRLIKTVLSMLHASNILGLGSAYQFLSNIII